MKRIIYGINPVAEALCSRLAGKNAAAGIERILASSRRRDKSADGIMKKARAMNVEVKAVSDEELSTLCKTRAHQGVVALMKGGYPYRSLDDIITAWRKSGEKAFFLLLDEVQDPMNMGAVIRSANLAGVHGIVVPKDRASEVTPTVTKASAGATEHTAIVRVTNLKNTIKRFKDEGVWVTGIEAGSEETIYQTDFTGDVAIVVGSEGRGIRRLVKESCDFCAHIPMRGQVNSLNAAQAGTVTLFEVYRQRDYSE